MKKLIILNYIPSPSKKTKSFKTGGEIYLM